MTTADSYKRLVRIYLPEAGFAAGENYALPEDQAHYLRNVMRKNEGDALRVFNGQDGDWLATLSELNKKKALITLDKKILEQKSSPDVWVIASPVKKEAFDLMIEKSCELGAAGFVPVICDHTVVHKINRERLQAIATEAAEQSERLDVMEVAPLISLKDFLNSKDWNKNIIFCVERREAPPLSDVVKKLGSAPRAILIGPEGGFSEQEIAFISSLGNVHPASLGPRILKAETALIAALSCTQILSQ